MDVILTWSEFKNQVNTKSLPVQYTELASKYIVYAGDSILTYFCDVMKDSGTPQTEFEASYKSSANAKVSSLIEAVEKGTHERFVYVMGTLKKSDGDDNMAVNGSVTPVNFEVNSSHAGSIQGYLEELFLAIYDPGDMNPTNFGAIAGLSNGVKIDFYLGGTTYTFTNVKNNYNLLTKFPDSQTLAHTGTGFMNNEDWFKGSVEFLKPIKMDFAAGDYIRAIVRDNLTALAGLVVTAKFYRVI